MTDVTKTCKIRHALFSLPGEGGRGRGGTANVGVSTPIPAFTLRGKE